MTAGGAQHGRDDSHRPRVVLAIKDLRSAGAERALVTLATGLDPQRWEVHVLCVSDAGELLPVLQEAGIPVHVVHKHKKLDLGVLWRIAATLKRIKPDLVHCFMFTAGAWVRPVARYLRIPHIIYAIRCAPSRDPRIQQAFDRLLLLLTDFVTMVSASNREEFHGMYRFPRSQTTVIRNGIDLTRFPARIRSWSAKPVLGTVGRLEWQKGVDLLLAAFSIIKAAYPDCRLRIAGDGSLRPQLERQAELLGLSGSVEFLGHVGDVPAFLQSVDVYLSATRFEGVPNAHLEAMASGLPVISTAVDGIPEIIEHGVTGWLTGNPDPAALAELVIFALRDPEALQRMGRRAQDRIHKEWTSAAIVGEYDRLYMGLVTSGRPREGL